MSTLAQRIHSQVFYVTLKAIIQKDDQILLMQERVSKLWELPGGRINEGEEVLSEAEIMARELREELGDEIRFDIGPVVATTMYAGRNYWFYLVARVCTYRGGTVQLSDEHMKYRWVDKKTFSQFEYVSGYGELIARFFNEHEYYVS